MTSITDDRYLWSRVLLTLLASGLLVLGGLELVAYLAGLDPEDKPSRWWIYGPGAAAVVGLVAAVFGGRFARLAAGVYGLAAIVGGVWLMVDRPLSDWVLSGSDLVDIAICCVPIAVGVSAVVASLVPQRADRVLDCPDGFAQDALGEQA